MNQTEFNRRAPKYLALIAAEVDDNANILRLKRILESSSVLTMQDQITVYRLVYRYREHIWDKDSVRFAEDRRA